ncbi:GNAT family N-acetyltransferase [Pasteurellaceae bacterium LIM206]|nr:GNAT family N-acetyltransferase [Pasteurellaceae bacterium LIM206]
MLEKSKLYLQNKFELCELPKVAKDRLPVYKFWYDVYHNEMKRKITDLNHSKQIIFDDLEPNSSLFCILNNKEIVGSVRLSDMVTIRNSYYMSMLKNVLHKNYIFLTKLIINKRYRKRGISRELIRTAEEFTHKLNRQYLVLDCNSYMVTYFEKLSFQLLTGVTVKSPHYGNVYLMLKEV